MPTLKRRLVAVFICAFVLTATFFGYRFLYGGSDSKSIIIYGDTRTQQDIHQQVANAISRMKPDLIFHLGDCATGPDEKEEWDQFTGIIQPLREQAEFYPIVGNHDVWDDMSKGTGGCIFFDVFDMPHAKRWYSVDVENIRFLALDTTLPISPGTKQHKWLEENLKEGRGRFDFIIPLFHHPPFSVSYKRDTGVGLRSVLVPLFKRYGVKIAFCGHSHNYQRIRYEGIYFIVTAGGGAPLYDRVSELEECQLFIKDYHFCVLKNENGYLNVTVFDKDLIRLDEFVIKS